MVNEDYVWDFAIFFWGGGGGGGRGDTYVCAVHALHYVRPDADIVWKLLSADPHARPIRRIEPASEMPCAPYKRAVPLDLPPLDRRGVDG